MCPGEITPHYCSTNIQGLVLYFFQTNIEIDTASFWQYIYKKEYFSKSISIKRNGTISWPMLFDIITHLCVITPCKQNTKIRWDNGMQVAQF